MGPKPVTVLTAHSELLAVAEALLQGAGIAYVVINRVTRDPEARPGIQVHPDDVEAATDLLKDLEPQDPMPTWSPTIRWVYLVFAIGLPTIVWMVASFLKHR